MEQMNDIEVLQLDEGKFRINNNIVEFLNNNVVYVQVYGAQTNELSQAHLQFFYDQTAKGNVAHYYLIDLNKAGKSTPDARKVWQQLSEEPTTKKVAVFGLHPVARVLASFVLGKVKRNANSFFKTQEEALAWINAENNL